MLASDSESCSRDAAPACLGDENPNRLVTLWDIVNQFDAFRFGFLCHELFKWRSMALLDDAPRVVPEIIKASHDVAEDVRAFCEQVGFDDCLQKAIFSKHHLSNEPNTSVVSNELRCLFESLLAESRKRKFLRVADTRVTFVDQDALLGQKVCEAFPSARFDIREAGNCLAAECNTAAVFHMMRVVEWGLRALCVKLGFKRLKSKIKKSGQVIYQPVEYSEWERILDALQEKVDRHIAQLKRGPVKQKRQQFYYPALQDIRGIRDAWRNHVMHTRAEYTGEDADAILSHVKRLMKTLADNGVKEV